MEITLTRDSIIGLGKIEYPKIFNKTSGRMVPDISRAGIIKELNWAKRGQLVDIPDRDAARLVDLASALAGDHRDFIKKEDEQKKAESGKKAA